MVANNDFAVILPTGADLLFGRTGQLYFLEENKWVLGGSGSLLIFRDPFFVNIGIWNDLKKVAVHIIDTTCLMEKIAKRKFFFEISGFPICFGFQKEDNSSIEKAMLGLLDNIFKESLFANLLSIQDEVKNNRKNPVKSVKPKKLVPLIGKDGLVHSSDKVDGHVRETKTEKVVEKPKISLPDLPSDDSESEDDEISVKIEPIKKTTKMDFENPGVPKVNARVPQAVERSKAEVKVNVARPKPDVVDNAQKKLSGLVAPIPAGNESDDSSSGEQMQAVPVAKMVKASASKQETAAAKTTTMDEKAIKAYIDEMEIRLKKKMEQKLEVKDTEIVSLQSEVSDLKKNVKSLTKQLNEQIGAVGEKIEKLEAFKNNFSKLF